MAFNLFLLGRDRFFTVYICFEETLFFCLYFKIMKKPYMHTIIGSSGRDCVSVKAGLFKGNLFWVGQYDHPPLSPFPQPLY